MIEQALGVRPEYFLNSPKHEFLHSNNSNLSPIQQAEEQCEKHANQDGSSKRKVKCKVIALIMEVQREPAEPEWQLRSQHEQKTDKRQDAAHNDEQSAYLLHKTILRQRQRQCRPIRKHLLKRRSMTAEFILLRKGNVAVKKH